MSSEKTGRPASPVTALIRGLALATASILVTGVLPATVADEGSTASPASSLGEVGASLAPVEPAPSAGPIWAEWRAEWHPAFRPRVGRVGIEGIDRVGDDVALTGYDASGAVAWWSADGLDWHRSRHSRGTRSGVAWAVDGTRGAYVMGGSRSLAWGQPAIWYSADGRDWRRSRTDLPQGTSVHEVLRRSDGTFVAYGQSFWGEGPPCWTAISRDQGRTWRHIERGGCVRSVAHDGEAYVGLIRQDLASSLDGLTWTVVTPRRELLLIQEALWGDGWPEDLRTVGVVPIGDGRLILGGRGRDTLTWSQTGGPAVDETLIDWSAFDPEAGWLHLAVGPSGGVAALSPAEAPLVSPPTGMFTKPPRKPAARCPGNDSHPVAGLHLSRLQRLRCFGGRTLSFDAWVPFFEYGGSCPYGAPYTWLACFGMFVVLGPGMGADGMTVYVPPDARGSYGRLLDKDEAHLRITGHFDDPAAARCPPGTALECRSNFVVTNVREVKR